MASDELLYNPTAIDGEMGCVPACINEGVCMNKICFCASPYGGDFCQNDLGVDDRVNILLFVIMIIGGIVIGFLLVFILKFLWDLIFIDDPDPPKNDEDGWKSK